jgi:hypothetical protein
MGLIGAGIFVADPLNGCPPGTPVIPIERTMPGMHRFMGRGTSAFALLRSRGRDGKCLARDAD